MSYTDDGILLDYDKLRAHYPLPNPNDETRVPSPIKTENSTIVIDEKDKETKKEFKSPLTKGISHLMQKPSTIHSANLEDNSNHPIESVKEDGRKSLTRSEAKRAAKELKDTRSSLKKIKVDVPLNETRLEEDDVEFDSTKETTVNSTLSEKSIQGFSQNEKLYEGVNKKALPKRGGKRTPAKKGKKNKKDKKKVFQEHMIELGENLNDKANYLINPIPNFFQKFKTENMYIINRSFYFDPIKLSLSN